MFNRLLREPLEANEENVYKTRTQDEQQLLGGGDEDDDDADEEDAHKQYAAIQKGRDIPLKGLRKLAPQPSVYKGKPAD